MKRCAALLRSDPAPALARRRGGPLSCAVGAAPLGSRVRQEDQMKRSPLKRSTTMARKCRCTICGTVFEHPWWRKTCSSACRGEAIARQKRGAANPNFATPEEIAARRERKRASNKRCTRPGCERGVLNGRMYCSRDCHYADAARAIDSRKMDRLVFACERCGAEFMREPGRGTGRYCSPKCKRNGPLGPRGQAAPRPVRVVAPPRRHTRREWNAGRVWCAVGECQRGGKVHRHHVIYAQHVLDAGGELWDPRNRIGLCAHHHANHHGRGVVIPVRLIPDEALAFAFTTLGPAAFDYFRRYYAGEDARLDGYLARAMEVQ